MIESKQLTLDNYDPITATDLGLSCSIKWVVCYAWGRGMPISDERAEQGRDFNHSLQHVMLEAFLTTLHIMQSNKGRCGRSANLQSKFSLILQTLNKRMGQLSVPKQIRGLLLYVFAAFLDEQSYHLADPSSYGDCPRSLVLQYFNESHAGEHFFKIFDYAVASLSHCPALLHALYLSLRLGFVGQYALSDDSHLYLEQRCQVVYAMFKDHDDKCRTRGGEQGRDLKVIANKSLVTDVDLKGLVSLLRGKFLALSLLLVLVIYVVLSWLIDVESSALIGRISVQLIHL